MKSTTITSYCFLFTLLVSNTFGAALQPPAEITNGKRTLASRLLAKTRSKRTIGVSSNLNVDIFSRSASSVASDVYENLYKLVRDSQVTDIALLLDSSSSMGDAGFKAGRHLMGKLMAALPKAMYRSGAIKAGMINYSIMGAAERIFDFSFPYGRYPVMVKRAVHSAKYQGHDYTENHGCAALAWSHELLNNSSRSTSSATTRILIYATAGMATDHNAFYGNHIDSCRMASNAIEIAGIHTFVIAVGDNVDKANIMTVASKPTNSHIIPVKDVDMSEEVISDLKELIQHHDSSQSLEYL